MTGTRAAVRAACAAASATLLFASPAIAQEKPAAPGAENANITSYEPAFFSQFRPYTALDMIGRIPGFIFDGGNSGSRGLEGNVGNVLIDGERPASRSDSVGAVLSRIPSAAVLRIDIVRGGAPGVDMGGKSVVANVIRKKDVGLTGAVTASGNVNSNGDPSAGAGLQVQRQGGGRLLEGAINYSTNKGSNAETRNRTAPSGAVILQGDSEFEGEFETATATGAYETALFGGKVRVNGQIQSQSNSFTNTEDQTIPPDGVQVSDNTSDQVSGEAGLRYTRNFGDYGLELVGLQSLRSSESTGIFNTPTFTSGSRSESDSGESIARAIVKLPKFGKISVETGVETAYNFVETTNARLLNGQAFVLAGDKFEANELRTQAFGALTWRPSPTLSAELGARYEWSTISAEGSAGDSEKTLGFFKPRLNVSWTPKTGHQYQLRIERIVDQLSFGGFASSASFENQVFGVGNPQIEPEKSWLFDARYERRFGGQNVFSIDYTHRRGEDVLGRAIVVVPSSTPGGNPQTFEITRNTGTSDRDQLDMQGTFELDRFGMKGGLLNLGVQLRDSTVNDPVTMEDHSISGVNPWSWNVSLQQTLNGGAFRWALFLEDDDDYFSYSPRSVSKSTSALFIGFNLTWKPTPKWALGAGYNNIARGTNRSYSLFYDAPRNVGTPLYLEKSESQSTSTFFVNLRRNF